MMEQTEAASVEDHLLLCEACEHHGPKLVAYVDNSGAVEAPQFYSHITSADVRDGMESFVSQMLGTDSHYAKKGDKWTVPHDSHRIVHAVRFLGSMCAAFLYTFTLPDLSARGFVRPFTIILITQDSSKFVTYYRKLKAWVGEAVRVLKAASFSYFLSRARHIAQASDNISALYESKKHSAVFLQKAFLPLLPQQQQAAATAAPPPPSSAAASEAKPAQQGQGESGGSAAGSAPRTNGDAASAAPPDDALLEVVNAFVASLRQECRQLDAMTTSIRNAALAGSITLVRLGDSGGRGAGLGSGTWASNLTDVSATANSESASAVSHADSSSGGVVVTNGLEGLSHLSLPGWVAFLQSFVKKTPSPTPLRSIEKWLGTRAWHRSLTKLVLALQVLDKHPMQLYMAEVDSLSYLPPPQPPRHDGCQQGFGSPPPPHNSHRGNGDAPGAPGTSTAAAPTPPASAMMWGLRSVYLLFGQSYTICPQRLLEIPSGSEPAGRPHSSSSAAATAAAAAAAASGAAPSQPWQRPQAPAIVSPYHFPTPAAAGLCHHGLLSLFSSLKDCVAKSLVHSLLRGRPVFVIGRNEGAPGGGYGGPAPADSVRGAVSLLSIFVPSCWIAEDQGGPAAAAAAAAAQPLHGGEAQQQQQHQPYHTVRVVPYTVTGVQLSHLNELRLCGLVSRQQLPANAERYCSILNLDTREYQGPEYIPHHASHGGAGGGGGGGGGSAREAHHYHHGVSIPSVESPLSAFPASGGHGDAAGGRGGGGGAASAAAAAAAPTGFLDEVFGKDKRFPSDGALFHALQAVLLKVALRASVVFNSLLIEGQAGGAPQSVVGICTPAMCAKLLGFPVLECDAVILDYLVRLMAEASLCVACQAGVLKPSAMSHLSGSFGAGLLPNGTPSPTAAQSAQAQPFPILRLDTKQ